MTPASQPIVAPDITRTVALEMLSLALDRAEDRIGDLIDHLDGAIGCEHSFRAGTAARRLGWHVQQIKRYLSQLGIELPDMALEHEPLLGVVDQVCGRDR